MNPRVISFSYPWIGVPMELMTAARLATWPFLLAHLIRLAIASILKLL